jgi:hydrogenase-4 component F
LQRYSYIGQADYKRLLAYSSVEHMGFLALGTGLGRQPFTALCCMRSSFADQSHALSDRRQYIVCLSDKTASQVRGLFTVIPLSGLLWVAGLLAITGFPPFGTFLSEFTILQSTVEQGRYGIAAAFLVLLAFIFVGFSAIALRMPRGVNPNLCRQPASRRWR